MAKQVTIQNQIKAALVGSQSFDSVIIAKGAVIAKRGYFYHLGLSCETLTAAVNDMLHKAGIQDGAVKVTVNDHFHTWPKSSFFKVEVTA
jgi:hypothetical protein